MYFFVDTVMTKRVQAKFLIVEGLNATDPNGDVGEIPAPLIIPFPSNNNVRATRY